MIDVRKIKEDFPILKRLVHDKPLIYLDSAATSQKPRAVIDSLTKYYQEYNANIHRGIHYLSEKATEEYEYARKKVAKFINAKPEEIVFVRGTTEAINLVSYSWGSRNIKQGDGVLLTEMEHHSSLVPWQQLAIEKKAKLDYIGITDDGLLKEEDFEKLNRKPKILSLVHVSNVLGTINPVKEITKRAHKNGTLILLDGAQSVPHMPVDVRDLDCDFLAFSGHKMLGPTGIGVLYAKKKILEDMKPFNYGGGMIKEVYLDRTTWYDIPGRFEAGTPDIAGAIGLGAAVDYLEKIGMKNIREHEKDLTKYALEKLQNIKNLTIYGPTDVEKRGGVISFNLGDIHAHDLSSILDSEGIAIRSGHHCAMPLHNRLGIPASARASFYLYNSKEDVDALIQALGKATKIFGM